MNEDITSALARFPDITVLAPKTVAPYKGKAPSRDEIARISRSAISPKAASGAAATGCASPCASPMPVDGTLIWADQYDTDADQVIAVQDDITRKITGALAVRLTNVEQARVAAKPPPAWKPTISCCVAATCSRG